MRELKCSRCGHIWIPRVASRPKACPECKNRKWDCIKQPILNQEAIKALLDYDSETGDLIWREHERGGRAVSGGVAGSVNSVGYLVIGLFGKAELAHRLVWLWNYGYLPEHCIDHIDENKLNNRLDNLREASKQCNARNCGTPADNTSGVRGVSPSKKKSKKWWKKWRASIAVNRKQFNLGIFEDFDEAVAHRLAAEQCLDWAGCQSSSPAFKHMARVLGRRIEAL